jgi:hypothetical protein
MIDVPSLLRSFFEQLTDSQVEHHKVLSRYLAFEAASVEETFINLV